MAPKIEIINEARLTLGEGPHWDAEAQALYYVDILNSTIYKYDARTKKTTHVLVDQTKEHYVSVVIPVAGTTDKFLITYDSKIAFLTWDGVSPKPTKLEILVDAEPGTLNRFNDGKTDPNGRFWSGTMLKETGPPGDVWFHEEFKGSLFSFNLAEKSVKRFETGIGISNGLAWTQDNKTVYYIDSLVHRVDAFDYDIKTGEIKNRRVAFDLKKNNIEGLPDGMTIDKEGKLWVAVFHGNSVIRVDPDSGSLLQRVVLPAAKITSAAWGGANLDELYVTSAAWRVEEGDLGAGQTFKVTGLGFSGFAGVPVKL